MSPLEKLISVAAITAMCDMAEQEILRKEGKMDEETTRLLMYARMGAAFILGTTT